MSSSRSNWAFSCSVRLCSSARVPGSSGTSYGYSPTPARIVPPRQPAGRRPGRPSVPNSTWASPIVSGSSRTESVGSPSRSTSGTNASGNALPNLSSVLYFR
ncbi:hypothetical protein CEP50_11170 [Actinopolyspora mortivallis]|uniref:Uncharacterized protein n=1 Tax=Actinopolyspora mortivallis TaxID=33906 RepID=A0A2T0GVV4_ACTMO|nr:hypothetical protein CEP50_11170 [Actinopolyspora mortivallis]